MAYVKVGENESIESAIKRFKKKVDNEGIIKEFKDRQYFKKPSLARHEKIREYRHKMSKKD